MAEQEQLDIVISLRDEASETAKKVRAAMGQLRMRRRQTLLRGRSGLSS